MPSGKAFPPVGTRTPTPTRPCISFSVHHPHGRTRVSVPTKCPTPHIEAPVGTRTPTRPCISFSVQSSTWTDKGIGPTEPPNLHSHSRSLSRSFSTSRLPLSTKHSSASLGLRSFSEGGSAPLRSTQFFTAETPRSQRFFSAFRFPPSAFQNSFIFILIQSGGCMPRPTSP